MNLSLGCSQASLPILHCQSNYWSQAWMCLCWKFQCFCRNTRSGEHYFTLFTSRVVDNPPSFVKKQWLYLKSADQLTSNYYKSSSIIILNSSFTFGDLSPDIKHWIRGTLFWPTTQNTKHWGRISWTPCQAEETSFWCHSGKMSCSI